ncbi:hypothetical protein ACOME3_005651 [Neoechinorhynchus agilis]
MNTLTSPNAVGHQPMSRLSDNGGGAIAILVSINQNLLGQQTRLVSSTAPSNLLPYRVCSFSHTLVISRSTTDGVPEVTNALFEARVMSRNHAKLSFDHESGHFYLVDTNSSNGTYLNDVRLEASKPHRIYSCDVLRFGMDVTTSGGSGTEESITHRCVSVRALLFNNSGRLHPCRPESPSNGVVCERWSTEDDRLRLRLIMEHCLEMQKIISHRIDQLNQCCTNLNEESENNWKASLSEDTLLMRVAELEERCSKPKRQQQQHENCVYEQNRVFKREMERVYAQLFDLRREVELKERQIEILQVDCRAAQRIVEAALNSEIETRLQTKTNNALILDDVLSLFGPSVLTRVIEDYNDKVRIDRDVFDLLNDLCTKIIEEPLPPEPGLRRRLNARRRLRDPVYRQEAEEKLPELTTHWTDWLVSLVYWLIIAILVGVLMGRSSNITKNG